jgi:hypothetical protein
VLATGVQACALDSKPSLSANGVLPALNTAVPLTPAQLAAFAPFVFQRPYAAGVRIAFTENRVDVARSLTAAAMQRPWRWQFGDGKTGYGWSVAHQFSRPGSYSISVAAYDQGTKQWYQFDLVRLSIVPSRR